MSDKIINATDASFEADVLKADTSVLVDFWAPWCGPCKSLSPIIDEIAEAMDGRLKVVKVNIDENMDTPQKFGIRGIPALIIFKDGKPMASKVGSMSKGAVQNLIDTNI